MKKKVENYMKQTIIISAFSTLGKTYLGNKYKNILDFEASSYKWIYNDKEIAKDIEKRKGVTDRIQNPNYPENYLKDLKKYSQNYDILLITLEKEIRNILKQNETEYFIAYPTKTDFTVQRAINRGNNMYFSRGLEKSYKQWYPTKEENILWVKEDEYLEDVLIKKGFIKE